MIRNLVYTQKKNEMEDGSMPDDQMEKNTAYETLHRYSGSAVEDFQPNLIITNFPQYVEQFAKIRKLSTLEGSMFKVCHSKEEKISILDFKIGSPAAALTVDVCSFLPLDTAIFLGMCGGLRKKYAIGDYLVPVASIRQEGTSNYYFPVEVPALANFFMQKAVTDVLEETKTKYYIGITYTTNMRFWEFNEEFKAKLKETRAQAIEMECATLFAASYKRKFPLGALLLVSDLPLNPEQIKTKEKSEYVFQKFCNDHIEMGVKILKKAQEKQKKSIKKSIREVESE